MLIYSLSLVLLLGRVISAPVDTPVRIDLPVYDEPQPAEPEASSNYMVPLGLLPENYPGGDPATGGNFISEKLQVASNFLGNTLDSKAAYLGPFAPHPTKLESAVQESEGLGSKALSVKENIQSIVAGLFQPKPLVDTISESEKYGNNGEKFYSAGRAIVGGASSVSNLLNSVLDVPSTIFRKLARAATEKLNNLGGHLVGL